MSLWVKICGNTSREDALLAAEAGADALGFVFAPSSRYVTVADVASIVPTLPAAIEKIGVFVDASFEMIGAAVSACSLTGVQLQFAADPDIRSRLRERFGPHLRIVQTLHFNPGIVAETASLAPDRNIDALLVDSRTATSAGGTGIAYDWNAASSTLFRSPGYPHKLVVAGGLKPENVAEAIAVLKPWGVDVVSGVEASLGRKDPAKVRAFIANARAAWATLEPVT